MRLWTRRGVAAGLLLAPLPAAAEVSLDFVADDDAVERFRAELPAALIDASAWPVDTRAPDYAHLDGAPRQDEFDLTAATLEKLMVSNGFGPRPDQGETKDKFHDDDHILFALRGCVLATGQASGVVSERVRLKVTRPNLRAPRCIVGVWRRRSGDGGPAGLLVVPGSTVPNAEAVALQHYVQSRTKKDDPLIGKTKGVARAANLLPTGRYNYLVGSHGKYDGAFPRFDGVFRLARRPADFENPKAELEQASVPVLRAALAPTVDLASRWDVFAAFDNIHPGITPKLTPSAWSRGVRFSSEGCITIWDPAERTGPPYGKGANWSALRAACGVRGSAQDARRYHSVCLLTGAEAALAAQGKTAARLRYGSDGQAVVDLQKHLGLTDPDGEFGVATLTAWLAAQRRSGVTLPFPIARPDKWPSR